MNAENMTYIHGNVYQVKVSDLCSNPNQARKHFGRTAMSELKESIAEYGLIHPITFTKVGDTLQLVSGERRLRAVKSLENGVIEAKYVDRDQLAIALAENLQREDLNAMEKAELIHQLRNDGKNLSQISKTIGKSVSSVSEMLSLNRLPEDIKSTCRTSDKYILTRLVQIAKASNFDEMRSQFKRYQKELAIGSRANKPKIDRAFLPEVMSQLNRAMTKIQSVEVDSMSKEDLCDFLTKLNEAEQIICRKANEIQL